MSRGSGRLEARRGATRTMAIALLAVVALAGMGLGFAADRLALHAHRGNGGGRRFGPEGFGGMPQGRRGHLGGSDLRRSDGMREQFARELDLTPDQRQRVDAIMSQQTEGFRRLREEMKPRFDSLLTQAQARIDSVLTPAQREKLQVLRAREVFGPRDSFGGRDHHPSPR